MELSELATYAEQKFHMKEEHKWSDFAGFSVLTDPLTNKWVALLMRQWDSETGTELQRCDIKCGRKLLTEIRVPYVTDAFRMKGSNWVGVRFGKDTDPDVVFSLFDEAVRAGRQHGYTIVLEEGQQGGSQNSDSPGRDSSESGIQSKRYTDTLLPLEALRGNYDKRRMERLLQERREREKRRQNMRRQESRRKGGQKPAGHSTYRQLNLFSADQQDPPRLPKPQAFLRQEAEEIPPRILEMMKLYDYTDGSFYSKCINFRRQGMYMADYEDEAPWNNPIMRYFTTYHDLNLKQLRGYFAWRTHVRCGDFDYIAPSYAYMYLYELLNGIGTASVEDSLNKMKEFEAGYLDSGIGDGIMRATLHRWMLDLAILGDLPSTVIRQYIPPSQVERDGHLVVLRNPQNYSDEEIFYALNFLSENKIIGTSAVTKEPVRSKHLFAEVWRRLSENYTLDGWDIFTACFGKLKRFSRHPLGNAVYMDRQDRADAEYQVTACRKYLFSDGKWFEENYDELYFDKYKIHAIVHEADRQIRRYLKAGHYLREKKGEEWVAPYVQAIIEADKAAIEEAARPRITIDLSGLDKIRRDAQITRDSLLTEEEMTEQSAAAAPVREEKEAGPPVIEIQPSVENEQTSVRNEGDCAIIKIPSLDDVQGRILLSLMRGEPVTDMIRDNHLMASVVTDSINEALFDEIGDNVLECDGEEITLVEDYREDLYLILGGDS